MESQPDRAELEGSKRHHSDAQQRTQMIHDQSKDPENVMSSSDGPERRPVIPARQARQGVTGHNVRHVLGFGLAAIVIVFAIIWIVYFA
jgi:hypothetical protein